MTLGYKIWDETPKNIKKQILAMYCAFRNKAEISRELGISVKTVDKIVYYARVEGIIEEKRIMHDFK